MLSFVSLASQSGVSVDYKGQKYYFSPCTFNDCAEYILWYQWRELEIAKQQTKDMAPALRDKILERTYNKCLTKTWNDGSKDIPLSWEAPEIQASLNTVEGIQYQLYLSLRHRHPDITPALADEIVTLATYQSILGKLMEVNGLNNSSGESTPSIKKTLRKRLERLIGG